jgi:hypothetical protein
MSTQRGCFPRPWEQSIEIGEVTVMKDRKRQRENRKLKHKEELIDRRNHCGVKDLTAYNAVLQIKTNGKASIILK